MTRRHTDLYEAVQQTLAPIGSSSGNARAAEPPPLPKASYGHVALAESAAFFAQLPTLATCRAAVASVGPGRRLLPSMEALGAWYGLVLYSRDAGPPFGPTTLAFSARTLHDRAIVYVDGREVGTAYRGQCPQSVDVPAGSRMEILVENMGRVNYVR